MGKKQDLEIKLFEKETTLMEGESLGPYTCGATDPSFVNSEIYVDTTIRLNYKDITEGSPIARAERTKAIQLPDIYERMLIQSTIRSINDAAIHELSHQYSKCGHGGFDAEQNAYKDKYIRNYSEKDFEAATKKILDWCEIDYQK